MSDTALRQAGAAPLKPGDPVRIGPYTPLGVLGSGGMGRVFLARPTDGAAGLAAVKVIRPEYAEDAEFRRRLEREAAVQASIHTPRAPRLQGTGFHDDLLWMATDYIPGLSLDQAVRQHGVLDRDTVWRLVAELAEALVALASAGVVHRDLKPSNVLLSLHGAQVIDFGISKAGGASMLTATGQRVGTPAFMAPEYLREGRSDTSSDVFSLGGTLVFAATGQGPFGLGTGMDVMHRVAFEEPNQHILGEVTGADPELGALLTACLAKDPALRPAPQQLVAAAAARPWQGWQQPLHGSLAGLRGAYETLHRMPLAAVPPHPATQRVTAPAPPPGFGPAAEPGRRRGGKALSLTLAAVVAIGALVGGAYALTRGEADPRPPVAQGSVPAVPGGATPDDGAASPLASASAGSSPTPTPTRTREAPSPTPAATRTVTASPTTAPTAEAAPPPVSTPPAEPRWISECTMYGGSELTRYGDKNVRVTQVQCMLVRRGYSVGAAGEDGDFGTATKNAVIAFQESKGLAADGLVGEQTWAALRSAT
ncbi:serine/threonine-protein kinase [Streptomyces coeruleoprunus]|uniref:Serine/threonine-protein kinase n=1 Tax=Streptomyces coeruleoprunus TaxID=285563 RepID=A0ABV9X8S9_9ACTN